MKKVLVITYYWPPSGKASLHWPLKIIKYLPDSGWQPSVLTVDNDTFSQKDESLLKDVSAGLNVIRAKSIEPFNAYKKFTGKGRDEQLVASETISRNNKSLTHKISVWIRMNLFIPDARVGWYFSAVPAAGKLLRREKFDAIISIGPPHTAHLVGLSLAKRNRIPHIPVFIDPWVDIAYYRDFKRNKITLAIDNYMEKRVLQNAASPVFVTKTMREDYIRKYPFITDKSRVLYWGYNEDDFRDAGKKREQDTETLVHAGNIFDYQNPHKFWMQVKNEIENGRNLRIKFIGTVSPGIRESIDKHGLAPYTEFAGFLPYEKLIDELLNASYLLVCATEKRHVPGKLFEYLRTGNPIIAFGDDNEEVRGILSGTNAGMIFNYRESGKDFFEKASQLKTNIEAVKSFDRREITRELSDILDKLTR